VVAALGVASPGRPGGQPRAAAPAPAPPGKRQKKKQAQPAENQAAQGSATPEPAEPPASVLGVASAAAPTAPLAVANDSRGPPGDHDSAATDHVAHNAADPNSLPSHRLALAQAALDDALASPWLAGGLQPAAASSTAILPRGGRRAVLADSPLPAPPCKRPKLNQSQRKKNQAANKPSAALRDSATETLAACRQMGLEAHNDQRFDDENLLKEAYNSFYDIGDPDTPYREFVAATSQAAREVARVEMVEYDMMLQCLTEELAELMEEVAARSRAVSGAAASSRASPPLQAA
jgi:hypothetical protein